MGRDGLALLVLRLFAGLFTLLSVACSSTAPAYVTNPATNPITSAAHESARAFGQRAASALQRGDAAAALALYAHALSAADSVEDFETSGAMLLNLALVHARLGQWPEAHQRLDRILLAPGRYAGVVQSQAATRKALLALDAPDLPAALNWVDRAEGPCADPCALAAVWADIRAHVALERGDAATAVAQATRAAALAVAPAQQAEQANAQRLLGRALAALGERSAAAAALQRALDSDRALGLPDRIALDLLYAGDNAAQDGQTAAARDFFDRALRVSEAAGLPRTAAVVTQRLKALGLAAARTP